MGYHRAGFDVVGVDIEPQPRYPFEFYQGDALAFVAERGHEFDAIHASPPCQAHTTMSNRWRGAGGKADEWLNLIPATRERLEATGRPWVLENVPGAKAHMLAPIVLHGGMFGLRVHRPRLFDSSVLLLIPEARQVTNPLGIYGKHHDGRFLFRRTDGTEQRAPKTLAEAQDAMGMPWADWNGCREAIPPAYTEFIGRQLLDHLREAVA